MLSQATKDRLKKLGVDADALVAAHNDKKEVDLTLPEGELLTADQLSKRDENTRKEGEKEGEKKALTIAITEINKHTGLELKAERFGDLGKQIKDQISASDNDKVKQLTNQVSELLKDKETLTAESTQAKTQAERVAFEYEQFKHLPANRNTTLTEREYIALMAQRGIEIKADGVYRNGELLKDATTKGALPHAEAYKTIFTEFNWVGAAGPAGGGQGGRGGGNGTPGGAGAKARSQSEAITKWQEQNPGKNPVSPEAMAFVAAEAKDNVAFSWND